MMDVVVNRVKWNGKGFPGAPFSDNPTWLNDVLQGNLLAIIPSDHDYTIWAAVTKDGILVAEPGDRLNFDPLFGLQVTKLPQNKEEWSTYDPNAKEPEVEDKPKRKSPARKAAKKTTAKRAPRKAPAKKTATAAKKTTGTRAPRKRAAKKT